MPETPPNSSGPDKRNLLIEQLEERALFDAVPILPIDAQSIEVDAGAYLETMVNAISADAEAGANQQEQVANKEVLFVDKSVEGFESVVAEFIEGRDVDVFFINDQSSGFEQIAKHLEGRSDLTAIHIVSHGNDALLNLGNSVVGQADLAGQHTSELVRIGQSLAESGDILIYGCDLASSAKGEAFIKELSQITNADVAASDDITGSANEGGDWVLEKSTGSIEAQSLASASFSGTLLVSDNGFVIGSAGAIGSGEIVIVPEGQTGVSSFDYLGAATANSGAITIDVRLTLVNTFDQNGNLTTGQANQLPVTFGNSSDSPVLLSRVVGGSVNGYQGHTAEIRVDFFSAGNPISIVGDFTFHDLDFDGGNEQVQVLSDEMLGYQISETPTSQIQNNEADGVTSFTNLTGSGTPADEERWVSIQFKDTTSHSLIFKSRSGHTGYGLSTKNFSATPLSFTPPTATDDDFATDQNTTLIGNIVSADNGSGVDSDPDGDTLTVANVGGLTANVGNPTGGTNGGLFTVNSDGSYTFDPNGEFDYLPAGQTATTTITYQIGDGTGLTDEATVTVVVTGLDDAPRNVGSIPPQTDFELQPVFVDLSGYFDEVDNDETLTYSTATLPPGLSIDPNTGIVSGLPNSNTDGVYTVSIVATDSDGETTTQTFDWTILPPVPVAFDNFAGVNKNGATADSGNLISDDDGVGADFDIDGDPLIVTEINGSAANLGANVAGTYGTLIANADGTYTYTLDTNNAAVLALTPGNTLTDSFTYTIDDQDDGTSTATLNVTISAGATWELTGDTSVDEGNIASYLLTLQDGIQPGETVSVDLALANIDTSGADYASFVAAVNAAIAGDANLSFDGTTLTYDVPYSITSSALGGAFDDISGSGTGLGSGDDDTDQINIGFDFDFYGNTYSQVNVGSNGFLTFGGGATEFNNQDLEAGQTIGNLPAIAGFWDDLDPSSANSDDIYYEVKGSPGNQELIVQWNQIVPFQGIAGQEITFQIVLSEGSSEFEIRYLQSGLGANAQGASATIGITDGASSFEQHSFNTVNAIPDGTILSFGGESLAPIAIDLSSIQDSLSEIDEKYQITISNATGGTSIGSNFTVTTTIVDDDNQAPIATDNTATVTEDVALTDDGNVITDDDGSGVDSDPEGDFIYVSGVDGSTANVGVTLTGTYGEIILNSDGSYTYTLDNNNAAVGAMDVGDSLQESFTYTISDVKGESATATLTIDINGANDAPLAGGTIPPQADLDDETITAVDVTGAFSDPDGDTLTYTATGLPAGLTLNLNSGLITGTIDNSASQVSGGVYSVQVTATDDNLATVSTTFTWTVTNPGPTATDNTGLVREDITATDSGNVITDDDGSGADSDPDGDTLTVSSFNGSASNVGLAVNGSYGTITIDSNGSYTYSVDNNNAAVDALDNGESLTETFAYIVSDGEGGTSPANLTITVQGTNDAPLAGTIPPQSDLDADTISTVDVTSAFTDPDGDTLTYTATGLPSGLTLDLNSGEITGTIDNSASQVGGGVYSVEVTATDDNGATVATTFSWTVTNPGPTATDNTADVAEDGTLTDGGNVITDNDGSGVDSDPDADDLSIAAIEGLAGNVGVAVNGTYGSIVVAGDGTYTYTLDNNNAAVNALDVGETLTDTFEYTLTDSEGGTATANVTVTINGANDAPLAGGTISPQSDLDDDTITTVDVTSAFSDPDGDTLTYTATGLPSGLTLDLNSGEITGTIDNSASQIGGGVYSVEVTATDDNGANVKTTFTWTVANPGPTATDNTAEVTEDVTASDSGNVITDNDGSGVDSDTDGDSLLVSSFNGNASDVGVAVSGTYGSITLNSIGSYTYTVDDNNPVIDALDNGETLAETFTYTVSDGEGGTSTANLTITINGTNDAPLAGGTIPPQTDLDADTISTVDVTSAFSDPDGDTLTYTATGLPSGLTLDLNSGEITGTIDNSASQVGGGVYSVEVTATDDNGATVKSNFAWTVSNPGPTATDNTANVAEDLSASDSGNLISNNDGFGVDSDPDSDDLVVSAVDSAASNVGISVLGSYGSIVVNGDGTYTYTLDNNNAAVDALDNGETLTETFGYTISDGEGGTSSATLSITIDGTNDAPLAGGTIPPQTDLDADTISTVDVTSAFSDPDGDTLTYTAAGLPSGLTLDLNSGQITGTIDNSASQIGGGTYSVEVTATDDNLATVSTTFVWTVSNPGPTATDNTADVAEDGTLTDGGNVITDNDGSGVDSDPDLDDLSIAEVEGLVGNVGVAVNGTYGSIVVAGDGTYTYTLNNSNAAVNALDVGETLTDSFEYTLTDSEGGVATANVTVTINGANDAPIPGGTIADQVDVDDETITAVNVTGAFSDPDGDTLTYTATGLPAGLTLNLNSGLITGTIDNSASQVSGGVYSVQVTATDDNLATVSTTFTWTVTNPGPTATDNTASVTEDVTASDSGNVITDNDGSSVDSDPDGDDLIISSFNGSAADVGVAVGGSYGSITLNSDGTYTYTIDDINAAVDALDNGETLAETFTYTVSDGEGGTSTANLTVTINGTNDAPLAGGTISPQTDLDAQTISAVDITSAFSDPDGDTLTYTATGLPAGLALDLNSGEITGTIDNSASQVGGGVYSVLVTATDDNLATVSTTFTWNVTNPGPTANNDAGATTQSALTSGNVISDVAGMDTDVDGDTITVNEVNGTAADVGTSIIGSNGGQFTIQSDGSYSFNPSGDFDSLAVGETSTTQINYTITDSEGGMDIASLEITITGENDDPTPLDTIPAQADQDAEAITTVQTVGYFTDADTSDVLSYSVSDLPAGLSINSATGEITGAIDNSASQGGLLNDGVYSVTVTADDGEGGTVDQSFTWTVTNPGPVAVNDTDSTDEETNTSGDVITGSDSDPDNDTITVDTVDGLPAGVGAMVAGSNGGLFTINSNGSYSFSPNGEFEDLGVGQQRDTEVTYTITDSEGGTATRL